MKVHILPRYAFERDVINSGLIHELKNTFILSIADPESLDKQIYHKDTKDYKTIAFYDIEYNIDDNGKKYEVITDEQVKEILNYILEHKDYETFIVHCSAGISRSGAIGEFVNDLFGEDYQDFKRRNSQILPNKYIKSKLYEFYNKQYIKHITK